MASFRGASAGQDGRFTNKEKKLLRTMSFPEVLDRAVDFKKVKLESLRPWIAKRVTEVLGLEDEVVENLVHNLLEEEEVNPKLVQIQLTPFLAQETPEFMVQLWGHLLSAQENGTGVPQAFLDEQAEERRRRAELDRKMDQSFQSRRSGTGDDQGRRGGSRWDGGRRSRWVDGDSSDRGTGGGHRRRRSRSPRRDYRRDEREYDDAANRE